MKHVLFLLLAVFYLSVTCNAQDKAIDKGDFALSAGVGVGILDQVDLIVPVKLNLDYSFHKYVSGGVFASYYSTTRLYFKTDPYRYNSLDVGVRGNFHVWNLISDILDKDLLQDKVDMYASVWSGFNFRSIKYKGTGRGAANGPDDRFHSGPVAGIRFFFKESLAVYAELGRNTSSFNSIGLTLKF